MGHVVTPPRRTLRAMDERPSSTDDSLPAPALGAADPPAEATAGMTQPSPQRLVEALLRDGPQSAEELAVRVGVTRRAVARHLRTLGEAGRVTRREIRHGVGRPRFVYDVVPESRSGTPEAYLRLATELLDAARETGGGELVDRLLESRLRGELRAVGGALDAAGAADTPLIDRVRVLAALRDDAGYLADVRDERGLRLVLHACPVLEVARRVPSVCDAELQLVGRSLGALVERESNIAAGGRDCVYRIRAREPGFPPTVWTSGQMRSDPHRDERPAPEAPRPWNGTQWAGRPRVSGKR